MSWLFNPSYGFGCLCSRLVLIRCSCVTWDEAAVRSAMKEQWEATLGIPALLGSSREGEAVGHWTTLQLCQCLPVYSADSDPGQTWLHGLTSDLPHPWELAWGSLDSRLMMLPASDLLCSSCSGPLPVKLPPRFPRCCSQLWAYLPYGAAQSCCSLASCLLLLGIGFGGFFGLFC